jgi:4,5-dihydroxyphthalate decarboxylase
VLQHEFGVAPGDMDNWMERVPSHSHATAVSFKPPAGVTVNQIPPDKSLDSMILSGELDAIIHYLHHRNLVDRSRADLFNHPAVKLLFPDPVAEGIRYYRKTGIYPINHAMVIRREIAEKHPWTVLNLLKAFEQANEAADRQRIEHVDYHAALGAISAEAGATLRQPVLRHGIKANRRTLETIAAYSHEQGLTPRLMKLDEVFAASTMDQ